MKKTVYLGKLKKKIDGMDVKKKVRIGGSVAIFVIILVALIVAIPYFTKMHAAEMAAEDKTQGLVESKEVSINSKLPGRISKIYVEEGQEVVAGQILAEIEDNDLMAKKAQAEAQVKAAQAGLEASKIEAEAAQAAAKAATFQVKAAKATLQKANNGARKQEVAQAQAAYDLWKKTYDRVASLYEKGAVSAQKVDEVKTQMEVAELTLSIANEGARSEDKSAAEAVVMQASSMAQAAADKAMQALAGVKASEEKLEMAKGVVAEVNSYVKDTKLMAPISGTITVVNSHEGELVSSGMSVMTVTDLKTSWVEVKVKETDVNKLSLGQKAVLTIPGLSGQTFSGKVVRINAKPDFATKLATNENGDFDVRAFGVKVELENSNKILRPGQTAFVKFDGLGN